MFVAHGKILTVVKILSSTRIIQHLQEYQKYSKTHATKKHTTSTRCFYGKYIFFGCSFVRLNSTMSHPSRTLRVLWRKKISYVLMKISKINRFLVSIFSFSLFYYFTTSWESKSIFEFSSYVILQYLLNTIFQSETYTQDSQTPCKPPLTNIKSLFCSSDIY